MYRSKGYNNHGDQKLWIKVDLKEIRFNPSGDTIRRYQCNQIEVLFRYSSQELAISLVESKEIYEIRIPLNQVTGFRNIQNKYIEFELRKNFFRTYLIHSRSPGSNVIRSQKDPTNGSMKDVQKLTFTPCEKVHPMTIFMFEIGIKKWATGLIDDTNNEDDDIYEAQVIEDLIIEDSTSSNNISKFYVICKFLTFTKTIHVSAEITFADLLKGINEKLDYEINSFKYINDGDKITVESEKDWNFAKLNFKKQQMSSFEIYIE